MPVKELGQVGASQVMEGFKGDDEEFEVDSAVDGEPMEALKYGGDVVIRYRVSRRAAEFWIYLNVCAKFDEIPSRCSLDIRFMRISDR